MYPELSVLEVAERAAERTTKRQIDGIGILGPVAKCKADAVVPNLT